MVTSGEEDARVKRIFFFFFSGIQGTGSPSVFTNVHGQRSLVGYSPWGHKESDMTEHKPQCHSIIRKKSYSQKLVILRCLFGFCYLFIWLHWVFVATCSVFSCSI